MELGVRCGEHRQFEERRVAIEEQFEALANQELAPLAVALDILGPSPGERLPRQFVDGCDLLEDRDAVGEELV